MEGHNPWAGPPGGRAPSRVEHSAQVSKCHPGNEPVAPGLGPRVAKVREVGVSVTWSKQDLQVLQMADPCLAALLPFWKMGRPPIAAGAEVKLSPGGV